MYTYDVFLCDSLEKVFPSKRPRPMGDDKTIPVFEGTVPAVQLVYNRFPGEKPAPSMTPLKITVKGAPVAPVLRSVELIPAEYPCHEKADSGYLSIEPGFFPDLLNPMNTDTVKPMVNQYRAVWIDFPGINAALAGIYNITVQVETVKEASPNGSNAGDPEAVLCKELHFIMDVRPQPLPPQSLIHTQWFHADCLAGFYRTEVFSEDWWKITEAFMEPMAGRYGINTVFTPVFTPPLDTEPGGERPTVQLVDITKDGDTYSFEYKNLNRWCGLCKKHGITRLEIPHFFTQWGAAFTPKIIARDKASGTEKRIFGWDVPAGSPSYRSFLEQFVPPLRKVLEENGYDMNHVIFHISDEPNPEHKENYKRAKEIIAPLVKGSLLIDALSDIVFYKEGLVEHPVTAVDHIAPFLEAKVPGLWAYYCTSQCYEVPNRFFAMSSARTRAVGILLYYFNIKGFLHWGYNYYYSQYSRSLINPFAEASGGRTWPAGDPFLVYPGEDGKPLSSVRAETHRESLEDYRLLTLVEEKQGREAALALIHEDFPDALSFTSYPCEGRYYVRIREKAAKLLGNQ
jgi:hypothetical protein